MDRTILYATCVHIESVQQKEYETTENNEQTEKTKGSFVSLIFVCFEITLHETIENC